MRRLKRRIIRYSAAGVALAAAIGAGATFTVQNSLNVMAADENTDSKTVIAIDSIYFSKTEAMPGDEIEIIATTKEEIFSFYVNLVNADDERGVELRYDYDSGILRGKIKVTNQWNNGEYNIDLNSIRRDFYGFDFDTSAASVNSLKVSGSVQDNKAPLVNSIYFDKSEAKPGDTVTVIADVTDDSLVYNVGIKLCKQGADPTEEETAVFSLNLPRYSEGTIKNQFTIDEQWGNATYEIFYVKAEDKYENVFESRDMSDIRTNTLTIIGSSDTTDVTGPVVSNVTFDKTKVTSGDVLTISADVADESEVDRVEIEMENETTNSRKTFSLTPVETGKVSASVNVTNSFDSGVYKISYITAYDKWGNVSGSKQNGEFEVNKSVNDEIKITNVIYDKEEAAPGDTVTVTVEIDGVEAEKVILVLGVQYDGIASMEGAELVLSKIDTNTFTGQFKVYDDWDEGLHKISYIEIYDTEADDWWVYNTERIGNDGIVSDKGFNVVKNGQTFNKPLVKSITFDKEIAYIGDQVEVTAITDDIDEIEYIDLVLWKYEGGGAGWVYSVQPRDDDSCVRLYPQSDGTLKGTLTISEDYYKGMEPGWWHVHIIDVFGDKTHEWSMNDFADSKLYIAAEKTMSDTTPSEEPTKPSEEPTQPSEEPTKPSEEPTQPSEEPTKPSEEPTKPSEEPTKPSEEPTKPSETPTEPVVTPERQADYSKVNEAISKVPSEADLSKYTDESVAALKAAIAAVVEGKKADEQGTVDAYADAIDKALAVLELKAAEPTEPTEPTPSGEEPAKKEEPTSGQTGDTPASRNVPVSDTGTKDANTGSANDGAKTIAAGTQASGGSSGAAQATSQGGVQSSSQGVQAASQGAVQADKQGAVQTTTPETGDKNHTPAWIAAIAAAGVALMAVVARRRKKEQ